VNESSNFLEKAALYLPSKQTQTQTGGHITFKTKSNPLCLQQFRCWG